MNAPDLEPSAELVDFVMRVASRLPPSHDRRDHDRYQFTVPVIIQPLDEHFRPKGEPSAAVSRDLSAAGIGLLHTRPVKSGYVEVTFDLPDETKTLLIKVLRCRAIGTFFDIGGCFITRPTPGQNATERNGR